METIRLENVSFTYPLSGEKALDHISFSVEQSEFIVLCGKSGCGKTTLLKQLKKNLIPYGALEGKVLYKGEPVADMDSRKSASEIGFVRQDPDNQIVTDKVWRELAFGLESLGVPNGEIRRRVAEMASYFDIQRLFRKSINELSGGEKQLLNLASVMVMQPELLILDEPTAQLDPVAASDFLNMVHSINRDMGITVIISEHRLEELFPVADRVMVMDRGRIVAFDRPRRIGELLVGAGGERHPMFYGLPSVMKIFSDVFPGEKSPLTIREGRLRVEKLFEGRQYTQETDSRAHEAIEKKNEKKREENAVTVKDLWFRYGREGRDVLRGLNLNVRKNQWYCLLGGNGAGKSTALKVISGILKARRGKVETDRDKLSMLPQDPQALFTEITAEEELLEALYGAGISDEEKAEEADRVLKLMEIEHLRRSNPYDLSEGEQQRLALGKILMMKPEILLLDEPTKGLDPFFKRTLAGILRKLVNKGVSILMASHDIEFCAEYADRCAMLFDGDVVSEGTPEDFFAGNSFYTTAANKIARKWNRGAITWEEVAAWLKETI